MRLYTPNANTQGYYKLDDVNDSSGNGRNLTNNGSCGFVAGNVGNCVDLGTANTTKYLSQANTMGIDGGVITLSIILKMRTEIASSEARPCVQFNSNTKTGYFVRYNYNGGTRRLEFIRTKRGVAEQGPTYNIALGTANWYHIVLTYDGTNIRGYVNGSLVAGPTAASGNGSVNDAAGFWLGGYGSGQLISAYLDEGIIENVAWDATKVAKYYNSLVKTINGLGAELVKTVNGLENNSIKAINGLAN